MSQVTLEQAFKIAVGHHQAGRLVDAESIYRQILAVQPNHPDVLHLLGVIAGQNGHYQTATDLIRQAISIVPTNPDYYTNLGSFLQSLGQFDSAIASYQQAIALKPDYPEAHNNLGNAFRGINQLDQAIACWQRALELRPNYSEAHSNLGNALKDMGQMDEVISLYRRAIDLNPKFVGAHDNLILTLYYHPLSDRRSLFAEVQRWNLKHAEPLKQFIQPHFNDRTPERRLRIGYISSDFHSHPVGRFILPLLTSHDHEAFQIFCYAQVHASDSMTVKLQSLADVWHSILGLSDEQVAQRIRQDQIDILIDLSMHTANNRLLVFARKPAPVQVTYLAYAGGTGMDSIDYRFTDRYLDPDPENEKFYAEKSVYLPSSYWCYQQSMAATPVNPLPAFSADHVTFGCLNNFCKISQNTLETWAQLLLAVAGSRLLLYSPAGSHREKVIRFLSGRGITPKRIELLDRVSAEQYLETYQRMDIALDPFPYAGGTTTCDALWMGVPVVTLAGNTAVGRAGVSILSNAGFPELIAQTREQYIQLATDLANDLPRLAKLRSTLRPRMAASPLMDAKSYTRSIESAYRTMWRNWCGV